MTNIYTIADNIITSLGFTSKENFDALKQGKSGIKQTTDPKITQVPMCASIVDSERLVTEFSAIGNPEKYTRLEKMMILSITESLKQTNIDPTNEDTLFVFSSVKGNIDLIENENHPFEQDRINLWAISDQVCEFFNSSVKPIFISNACISGVSAIITAAQFLKNQKYKNAIVCGGDVISEFTPSGFQSFKAVSEEPCKPYDANRTGITLGEGVGSIILTTNEELVKEDRPVIFRGGSNSNDANHISGPSRTGDGLYYAINNTLKEANKTNTEIDYISGHGTATPYNDEMESKAITWAKLEHVPVNSLKSYWGHTLGAAGIIECVAGIHSIKENCLIKSLGYSEHGVSEPINVIKDFKETEVRNFLKTASGFGGSNVAAYFSELNSD
ncbi:MAG: beta-ketoacyl synthase [Bacteroidales bacterium]|nr:beta-ketoacyl synthase [Bacteroidales bacterium]